MSSAFLLYGATGFVGDAIARIAIEYGLRPIHAGRDAVKLEKMETHSDSSFDTVLTIVPGMRDF